MDIGAWLRSLGLERYERACRENDISAELLSKLTPADLTPLGVTSIGHRRLLLAAIGSLNVATPATGRGPVAKQDRATEAERRQLTVMFCDLVGSTKLSASMDPEDLRAVIGMYHKCVAETVDRFGGFVAKYM